MWCSFILGSLLTLTSSAAIGPKDVDYSPTKYAVQKPPLDTPWTYDLGSNPWPEYPRPQMQRSDWRNLNGIWTYRNASGFDEPAPFGQPLPHEVLVPSCLESALSGIQGDYNIYSWFSHSFDVPPEWAFRAVLLNFGAVDYEATVYVGLLPRCHIHILTWVRSMAKRSTPTAEDTLASLSTSPITSSSIAPMSCWSLSTIRPTSKT